MDFDCGTTSKHPWNLWRFPRDDPDALLHFAIFALTPGISVEYVRTILYIDKFKESLRAVDALRHIAQPLAVANAATITMEDGYAMAKQIRRRRKRPRVLPHWCALAIRQRITETSWETVMTELRMTRTSLFDATKSRFHPLLLHRVTPSKQYAVEYQKVP